MFMSLLEKADTFLVDNIEYLKINNTTFLHLQNIRILSLVVWLQQR